jgi:hypothetical protein
MSWWGGFVGLLIGVGIGVPESVGGVGHGWEGSLGATAPQRPWRPLPATAHRTHCIAVGLVGYNTG